MMVAAPMLGLVGEFRAGFEELAEFVAVEGVMAQLAAFENGCGEGDVGGLMEVGPPTKHTCGDGEERFLGAEAIDGAVDGAGEIFGAEFAFPGFAGGDFFLGVESKKAFFAKRREKAFPVKIGEDAIGE